MGKNSVDFGLNKERLFMLIGVALRELIAEIKKVNSQEQHRLKGRRN